MPSITSSSSDAPSLSVPSSGSLPSFPAKFFASLFEAVAQAKNRRLCPELTDAQWLLLGTRRVLEEHPSGRGFLQHLVSSGVDAPDRSLFFESLKSGRRLALVAEVSAHLARSLPTLGADCWTCVPELDGFDLYAGDGHFHAAAAHDPRDSQDGKKDAVGHLFALDLRSHALAHLTVADQAMRRKEHDMRALKRLSLEMLRQGAEKGRKVIYVWDRAGIDFAQWHSWKRIGGLYVISREKENMKLEVVGLNLWDRTDPRNQGVLSDELVSTSQGVAMRRVRYHCPLRDEAFSYLTSEYTILPGAIAHLYRMRWEIEKTFDELKSKLGEIKAWATTANAKTMQAHFLCIAHNLMIRCESELEREHGVRNEAELTRRTARLAREEKELTKRGAVLPRLTRALQRITVRSVKFIRWLRAQLFFSPLQEPDIAVLRRLYATL